MKRSNTMPTFGSPKKNSSAHTSSGREKKNSTYTVPTARSSRSGLTRMAATTAPPTNARAKDSTLSERVVRSPSA